MCYSSMALHCAIKASFAFETPLLIQLLKQKSVPKNLLDTLFCSLGRLLLYDCHREDQIAWADIVDYILALYHLTEAGVNAIEVLCIATVVADEEL